MRRKTLEGVRLQQRLLTILFIWLAVTLTAACATSSPVQPEIDQDTDPRLGRLVDSVCFSGSLIRFYSVSGNKIAIRKSQSEAYLLRTGYCPNAARAEAISLPRDLRCLSRGDRIFVDDTPFPTQRDAADRTNSCLVNGIFEWNEDAVEPESDSAAPSDSPQSE